MENVLILVAYSILICDSRADFQCCLSVECGAFFSINIEKYHYLEQFRSPSPYKNPDWVKSINQNLSGLNCVMAITLVRLYKISILAFFLHDWRGCYVWIAQELSEFWGLNLLFEAMVKKLSYTASLELVPLMEIPGVKQVNADLNRWRATAVIWKQFNQLWKKAWKHFRLERDFNPWPLGHWGSALCYQLAGSWAFCKSFWRINT